MAVELQRRQLSMVSVDLPIDYVDCTTYVFTPPKGMNRPKEKIVLSASFEPARAACKNVVDEVVGRLNSPEFSARIIRKDATRIDSRDAHLLEYRLGEEDAYVSRRVVVDLGRRRYLSAAYETSPDPKDASLTWEVLFSTLKIGRHPAVRAPAREGFQQRIMPEWSVDLPRDFQRRELYIFRRNTGSQILFAVSPIGHPEFAGDWPDYPGAEGLGHDLPPSALVIEPEAPLRFLLRDENDLDQAGELLIRTAKMLAGQYLVKIELRDESAVEPTLRDQADAEVRSIVGSIRLGE